MNGIEPLRNVLPNPWMEFEPLWNILPNQWMEFEPLWNVLPNPWMELNHLGMYCRTNDWNLRTNFNSRVIAITMFKRIRIAYLLETGVEVAPALLFPSPTLGPPSPTPVGIWLLLESRLLPFLHGFPLQLRCLTLYNKHQLDSQL